MSTSDRLLAGSKECDEVAILRFTGSYRFLSNFWPAEVSLDGDTYPSVEHAYQAAKFDRAERRIFQSPKLSSGEAKRLGKGSALSPDWEARKLEIMFALLQQKFQIPDLKKSLLETGAHLLIEGNTWGDVFWGIDLKTGEGENYLGRLIMLVRDDLRSGT